MRFVSIIPTLNMYVTNGHQRLTEKPSVGSVVVVVVDASASMPKVGTCGPLQPKKLIPN